MSIPESASAIRAAATTSCAKRSMRRACLNSIHCAGSKSLTSQANLTGKSETSNCVIGPAPDSPASRASHVVATSLPSGVSAPRPVITTRLRPLTLTARSPSRLHAEAAVHQKHFSGDEGGLVRAEEAYRACHVFRLSKAAERRVREHRLRRLLGQDVRQLCLYIARGDDVRAHTTA